MVAGIAIAVSVISIVAGVTTSVIQGENAAKGAEIEAQQEEDAMAAENAQRAKRLRIAQATGRSLAAAGGIDPFSGSPLAVDEANKSQSAIETGFAQRNRRVRAALIRSKGQDARAAGILGAIGDGFGGAADTITTYKALNQ